jgi:PhzF family phenazine biosynthesis protein
MPVPHHFREGRVMSRLRIFRADAFTTAPCTGNPAAVVLGADLLDERQIQLITRELGGVDAAFVLPADGTDHDLRLRFFTPRGETGLVGHATLAVHAVLDALGQPPCHRQKQRGGCVDIERLRGPDGTRYAFSQAPPTIQGPLAADRLALVLKALGLDNGELDADCPPVVAGAGGSRALIALRSGAALAPLQPDLSLLASRSAAGGPAGFFVYSLSPSIPDCDSEARMFCPALGIPEDPVSGNAHAMLATHLHRLGRMPDRGGSLELIGRQGHHVGRPGEVSVHIEADAARHKVRVAGSARVVFEAVLQM